MVANNGFNIDIVVGFEVVEVLKVVGVEKGGDTGLFPGNAVSGPFRPTSSAGAATSGDCFSEDPAPLLTEQFGDPLPSDPRHVDIALSRALCSQPLRKSP